MLATLDEGTGAVYRRVGAAGAADAPQAKNAHVVLLLHTTEFGEGHARRMAVLGQQYAARLFSNHPDVLYAVQVRTLADFESVVVTFAESALELYARANGLTAQPELRDALTRASTTEYLAMQRTLSALLRRQRREQGAAARDGQRGGRRELTHVVEFGVDGAYTKTASFNVPV